MPSSVGRSSYREGAVSPIPAATLTAKHAGSSSTMITTSGVVCTAILLVFAIIEGCITAYLVARFNTDDNWPSASVRDRTRFLLFTSWWTVFFSILYIVSFFVTFLGVFASIASHCVYGFMTFTFWLAGAASFTQAIGGGIRCGHRRLTHCHQLVAAEAFAWIEWILFFFWFCWILFLLFKALRRGEGAGTDMRQV